MSLTAINLSEGYQKLIDCITNLAWIMDSSGQIHMINSAWQNYTGRSLERKVKSYLWDFLPEERQDKIKRQWEQISDHFWEIEQAIDSKSEVIFKLVTQLPNGTKLYTAVVWSINLKRQHRD